MAGLADRRAKGLETVAAQYRGRVLLVRAHRIKSFHAHDTNNRTKDVCLLKVMFYEIAGLLLDAIDCPLNVNWVEVSW